MERSASPWVPVSLHLTGRGAFGTLHLTGARGGAVDGAEKQSVVDAALKQVHDKKADGAMLIAEGGVVIIVAAGELGDALFDSYCEQAARRRVKP